VLPITPALFYSRPFLFRKHAQPFQPVTIALIRPARSSRRTHADNARGLCGITLIDGRVLRLSISPPSCPAIHFHFHFDAVISARPRATEESRSSATRRMERGERSLIDCQSRADRSRARLVRIGDSGLGPRRRRVRVRGRGESRSRMLRAITIFRARNRKPAGSASESRRPSLATEMPHSASYFLDASRRTPPRSLYRARVDPRGFYDVKLNFYRGAGAIARQFPRAELPGGTGAGEVASRHPDR